MFQLIRVEDEPELAPAEERQNAYYNSTQIKPALSHSPLRSKSREHDPKGQTLSGHNLSFVEKNKIRGIKQDVYVFNQGNTSDYSRSKSPTQYYNTTAPRHQAHNSSVYISGAEA